MDAIIVQIRHTAFHVILDTYSQIIYALSNARVPFPTIMVEPA